MRAFSNRSRYSLWPIKILEGEWPNVIYTELFRGDSKGVNSQLSNIFEVIAKEHFPLLVTLHHFYQISVLPILMSIPMIESRAATRCFSFSLASKRTRAFLAYRSDIFTRWAPCRQSPGTKTNAKNGQYNIVVLYNPCLWYFKGGGI